MIDIYDIAFSYEEYITPIDKVKLHKTLGSSEKILRLAPADIRYITGKKWRGHKFNPDELIHKAEETIAYMDRQNIYAIRYDSELLPYGLKHIPDPPFILYGRGNISFDYCRSISIVGTRTPDEQGIKNTIYFAEKLSALGFIIVSGLAAGVDEFAHRSTLNSGRTIAVLGSGIDTIYPRQNKQLAIDILINNGGIVSEYPPGTPPYKWNFPKRNRIIVGMTKTIFMIQSPARSGSIISGLLASDYNRDLFVIDPALNETSQSTNREINDGNRKMIECGGISVKKIEDLFAEQFIA